MNPRPSPVCFEPLEPRVVLSAAVGGPDFDASALGADVAGMTAAARRYRVDALAVSLNQSPTPVASSQQQFYELWLSAHGGSSAKPIKLVTPAPPPAAPESLAEPVTFSTRTFATFSQLVVTGSSGNDSITVTQSGSTIVIVANGVTTTQTGSFGQLAIYGGEGNDAITVTSTVTLETLIYGGAGNDTITSTAAGRNVVVTIGGGKDVVTGNGSGTSFWADSGDTVNASAIEIAAGRRHIVASFYQPFTKDPSSADCVPLELAGQDLRDPVGPSSTIRLSDRSLFGLGPVLDDINQGQISDCYFLADLAALAHQSPGRLLEMAVDLGDGTYAVQYTKSGSRMFVRVDADLGAAWGGLLYARPGASGNIWVSIMEKAYAFARTLGQNSYKSLDWGWMGAAFSDLGIASTTVNVSVNGNSLYNTIRGALDAGRAVTVATNSSVSGAPVVGSHAYALVGAARDAAGNITFTLYNTWGFDGAGNDGNSWDGLVTLSLAQLQANFTGGSIAN